MNQVSTLIRDTRAALGWSQRDLSLQSGIPQPQIARYESGRARPSLRVLARLALAMNAQPAFARAVRQNFATALDSDN